MTKIKHPTGGYNQLWRSDAYDSLESLAAIFKNPRIHTGKGYRKAEHALRGCAECGLQKDRSIYSGNQWRKGPGSSQCKTCVEKKQEERQRARIASTSDQPCVHRTERATHQSQSEETPIYRTGLAMVIPSDRLDESKNDDVEPFVHRTGRATHQSQSEETPIYRTGLAMVIPPDIHFESKESATRWEHIVDCVTCDAEGCNEIPRIRCDRCEMAYYCSERCRARHSHEHMNDLCRKSADEMRLLHRYQPTQSSDAEMRAYARMTQLSCDESFEALLAQAEYIHQADERWEMAILLYDELMMREQWEASPAEWRQVWMGASRCFFEMGIYDGSIDYGKAALEMNRMFPQSHKYIALSQLGNGDISAAIQTMKEAVLYEAPYDDENHEKNVTFLWRMMMS